MRDISRVGSRALFLVLDHTRAISRAYDSALYFSCEITRALFLVRDHTRGTILALDLTREMAFRA